MENIKNYEKYFLELEKIVKEFESEDMSLDQSMKNFQRGIELYRKCQSILEETDAKVKILIDEKEEIFNEEN